MRFLILIMGSLALSAAMCPADDPKPYPYPDHIHMMMGTPGYKSVDAGGKTLFLPAHVGFSVMGQTGTGKPIESYSIDPSKDILFINGVRYDYENRVNFSNPYMEEITAWYSVSGYAKATRRNDGGWNFDSIDGKEEKTLWDHFAKFTTADDLDRCKSAWKELGHSGSTKKRLTTMAECRDLWRKIESGDLKATQADNKVWTITK